MLQRHFCSTTYILDRNSKRTLLHFHEKLQTWLPPGGHVELNESPFEAAKREIEEEYGYNNLDFIHPILPRKLDERSYMMEMPHFLIEEDIAEEHIHMDWIFYAWLDSEVTDKSLRWFNEEELNNEDSIFTNVKDMAILGFDKFY